MGPAGVSNAMCIKGLRKRRVGTMIAIQSNAALSNMLLTNPNCTRYKRCMGLYLSATLCTCYIGCCPPYPSSG